MYTKTHQASFLFLCVCVLAGTGSVLKIQELLHICSESFKPEDMEEGGKEGGEGEGGGKPADTNGKAGGKAKDAKDKTDGIVPFEGLSFVNLPRILWIL